MKEKIWDQIPVEWCLFPCSNYNSTIEKKIISKIVKPTLKALKGKNILILIYVGLMIKDNEPYLIEYNVRMGDPE